MQCVCESVVVASGAVRYVNKNHVCMCESVVVASGAVSSVCENHVCMCVGCCGKWGCEI